INDDNLAREITAAGKSWRVYAEDLPNAGYTGGNSGNYVKRHNPFAYFNDVVNSSTQAANMVPFSQFASDLSAGTLPNFSFVVPNIDDDAHDGTLAQADSWLQSNIAPLLASPQFQQDGLLIVVFDEGADVDVRHVGGQVAAVLAGPKVKQGFRSTTFYQHESTLRLIEQALGLKTTLGNSAGASSMTEFFQ
ncbi:MAG TPA: alkaline phosphatase family protein, partial [Terriglobales bacterium]|nr:alkaline phosphatase family protein [Terriglobales bacterium]